MKGFGSSGSSSDSGSGVFILACIIIIIIIISCDHRVAAGDFVSTFCKEKSTNQTQCKQTLSSPVDSCGGNNITIDDIHIRCVARLVNTIAINAAKNVQDLANKINGTGKGKQKNPAKSCANLCKAAIEKLKSCSTYLNQTGSWSISNLQTYASGAETDIDTCGNEFTGSGKVLPDILEAAARQAMGTMNVLLAIVNKLKN